MKSLTIFCLALLASLGCFAADLTTNYAAKAWEGLQKPVTKPSIADPKAQAKATESLKTASLLFVENNGQLADTEGKLHPEILFTAKAAGAQVFVTGNSLQYVFTKVERETKGLKEKMPYERDSIKSVSTHRFTLELVGANPKPELVKQEGNAYYENYYLAHCPNGVVAHSYEKFTLKQVYPGVDWVVYSNGQGLKYDFVLAKGSDASKIKLKVKDANATLNAEGDLVMKTTLGQVVEDKPVSLQDGQKLETSFKDLGNQTFGFNVPNANPTQPLTIDPSVVWATYYGGSSDDVGRSCATDASGNVYLAGYTTSTNFPVPGAFQATYGGNTDAFLVKFNTSGSRLWATYYGGSGYDESRSCATDAVGNVYLAGRTESTNFPVSGAFQGTFAGGIDAFLVKLNSTGSRLWATYYGGSGSDWGYSCATDASGNVYLAGYTLSTDFPVAGAFQGTFGSGYDAFLVKFNSTGSRLWATYCGGSGYDWGYSCATDAAGNVYLAGQTGSSDFPVAGAFQDAYYSNTDAFLVKFNSTGSRLWATYYGGNRYDYGYSCATDAAGNVYLAGQTGSTDFPVAGAFQGAFGGNGDAFLVKFNSTGSRLWATYYGGSSGDYGSSCATDAAGNVYLAGGTSSTNFPVAGAFQGTNAGNEDTFLVKFTDGCTPPATPTITAGGATTFCSGGSVTLTAPAGFTYLWSNNATTQSITASTAGSYTVRTIANGCTSAVSAATVVTVNTPPATPTITAVGPTTFCTGGSVTLTAPAGFTYIWSNGATTQGITASTSGSYTVQTIANGCTSAVSTATTVTVNTPPAMPTITAGGATTFCTGGSVTLTAPAGFTYLWSNNATTQSITASTAGSYTVRTIANGCTSATSTATVVTVNTPPATPTITAGGATTFCSGGSLTLTAPAGFNYLWSNNATTQAIIASTAGSYTVRTIANGCTSATSLATVVTVNTPPATPTITAGGATTFCTGGSVILTAPAGFSYLWSNGATTQAITASTAGSYTVRTIANGCTSATSSATVVTVNTPPATPTITAGGATTFCSGGSVTLTAPAGFTYLWSTNATTQSITASTAGSYTVRTIANGCTSATSTATVVTVNTPPTTPTITAGGATTFCTGGSVTLSAPAGFSYLWSNNATTQSITASTAGSYTVRTIANGCTSATSAATVVTVNTPPATPTITAVGPTTFCTGGSVTLTAPAGFSYLWSNNSTTQNVTVNAAGSYTVRTIANGCTSAASAATVVTVNTPPATPTITAGGATTFCSGGSVTLTAPAGFSYLWSNNATTQSITASTAGSYTVRTILGTCTSAASAATVVTVNAAPATPTITAGGPTSFCTGGSVTLTAPAGFSYLWSNNATTQSITASTAGSYTVRTIANGCTSATSTATVVTVNPAPSTPTITAGGPTTFCSGGSVTLTAPAGFTYLWSNNATTQSITASTAGSYTVRTIANGCTSAVSAATVVTVNTPPATPTITAGGPATFCTGGSVTLTAPAGFTYLWSNNATTQSITASTAGSYTVRTIANGCTSAVSSATVVNVINLTTPNITVSSGITTLFPGSTVTLTAPAGFSYLWSNNATTQSITVNTAGSYTVRTIASGCTSAVSPVVTTTTQPNFELYADSVYTKAGGLVSVPVRVRGFNTILGMQGEITLPAGTTYQNISNLNSTLALTVAGNFGLSAIGQNTLYFTWDDQGGLSRTLANGTVLFNIDLSVGASATPGNVLPILFPNTNNQVVVALGSGVRVPNANIQRRQGAVIIKGMIAGKIVTRSNITVPGVRLNVRGGFTPEDTLIAANGTYSMSYPAASGVVVSPRKTNDVNRLNGIDVMDLTVIRRHILGSTSLNNAYRAVAADVDRSNSVTASDMVFISDLILRNRTSFPQSRSWVFVRSNQTFSNQNSPWPVDTFRTYATIPANAVDQDFVACKLGDVDESYNNTIARRGTNQLQAYLSLNRATITRSGDTAMITMTLSGASSSGIQFTTRWDSTKVRFAGVASNYAGSFYANLNRGTLTVVSTNPSGGLLPRNLNLITIKLVALSGLTDSALVNINSDVTPLLCYDSLQSAMQVNVIDGRVVKLSTTGLGTTVTPTLTLHPNPASTSVQLNLSYGDIKQVDVIDQLGRTLITTPQVQNNNLDIGNLSAGTYVVRVLTTDGVAFRKMVKL